jgi:hypothetical protein
VWPSIRTWMRSASTYPCLRREENPGGRTGYPENYWDSYFVSPKCGKRMGLTVGGPVLKTHQSLNSFIFVVRSISILMVNSCCSIPFFPVKDHHYS